MSETGIAIRVAALFTAALAAAGLSGAGGSPIELRDAADSWGLHFVHHDGAGGRRHLPETMGSGVVVFDYDEDGDQDVFFVDGGPLPGSTVADFASRLFRNDGGRFVEVTAAAGLRVPTFGAGGTAGDVDGDGDLDLHVTAYGPNLLFRNEGDGSFTEVGARSGVDDALWGSSAAFADPDRDGDLDLYVANYVDFAPTERTPCRQAGVEVYCHPGAYEGLPDRYFRNRGNGVFDEASFASGLAVPEPRAGLGVAFGDLDDDGWPDLYVANDAEANFLFLNKGDGTFEESALLGGTAYSDAGRPEAGMGVALADTDGDGRLDIVVTNFELETNALYRNLGEGLFSDVRFSANVAEASLLSLAFGVAGADLDQDGDLDLLFANGHILDNAAEFHARSRYAQPNQFFENLGDGRFRPREVFGDEAPKVSRGLATGDLDGDGDLDVVINNVADRAEVWSNEGAEGGWLLVDLRSATGNRHGIGARLTLLAAGTGQVREIGTGSSYLSQSALPAHFGLGAEVPRALEVRWPDGRRQRLAAIPAGHRLRLLRSR